MFSFGTASSTLSKTSQDTTSQTSHTIQLVSCEIESCQRISATLCRHCKKNVCRSHFSQHADQLVLELNPLCDGINQLGEKIRSFSLKYYEESMLEKLTRWRDEAIKNINDLYELKRQKLVLLLKDNEEIFSQQTSSHLKLNDALKNDTVVHVNEGDVTFEELQILKQKLNELQISVNKTHNSLVYCDIKPLLVDYSSILLHSEENNYMIGGSLLCADYQMRLNDFYGKAKQKWILIYKATAHGFRAGDFHRCSDGNGPTMTIIQAGTGDYLFGGYTEIAWTSDGKYKFDPTSFLFTLKNPHDIHPTKFLRNPNERNSVGHGTSVGPIFGGVVENKSHFCDIVISDDADEDDSRSDFPSTYLDTTGKGENLFTGTQKFKVTEIEVYALHNETTDDENEPNDDSEP